MFRVLAYGIAAACVGVATPALAHITAHPDSGPAGSHFETRFTVSHGCDGSPTVALRVKIPEGVVSVKPQMKPGWEVSVKTRKLDPPRRTERGETTAETVDEVDWRGGPLPNALYDTFGLIMKLPDASGRTLYFPTVQECERGANRWIGIPTAGEAWRDVREPAPFVKLVTKAP